MYVATHLCICLLCQGEGDQRSAAPTIHLARHPHMVCQKKSPKNYVITIPPPPLKIDDFQGPQLVVRTGRLLTLLLKVGPVVILWPLLVNVVMSILAKR